MYIYIYMYIYIHIRDTLYILYINKYQKIHKEPLNQSIVHEVFTHKHIVYVK